MSKINQIQTAIRELSGGAYQKLMDVYLYKRFGFENITLLGSHAGTDKTTKGTPDSYVHMDNGKFILIAYGTVSEEPCGKIEKDILACLDSSKTGISVQDIEQIICCHTSTNITPGQYKQLCSHFHNTIIIGMGDISYDLLLKYPSIAKDHLSVAIDTHQIFDKKDFIKFASHNVYSTPLDMPLLCRENELGELMTLLDANNVVMLCGKSGIGKTRLALEAADIYGAKNHYTVKIIKSNNELIYDDLQATFIDDGDFIIVVDDANQLVQLHHLLKLCISPKRTHKMKILLTVRDYAKESVLRTAKSIAIPAVYKLKPLKDESIKKIIIENLGIKNEVFIGQIQQISKGSVRLAIMAGICALKGTFESIINAFDIFDNYFNDIISGLNKKELLAASMIALFDSFMLKADEMVIQLASEQGICFDEFVEICDTLHKKEVISIFHNFAVKFEDQNLCDYLLYYVFFKTKWLTPSYIIQKAFPQFRHRIVYVFNTLIQLFNTEKNQIYIKNEIRKSWGIIKDNSSDDTVFQFIKAFHVVIPDEALLVLRQEIDHMPEVHTDFNSYDFKKTSNNHTLNSRVTTLLTGFKYSNHFEAALELTLYYLEHNTEYPMDFYFLFGEELGFDYDSDKYGFEQERILIEKLTEYYSAKKTPESVRCLSFCVSHCLKYSFSSTESKRDNTVTILQFGLPSCTEIFEIRALCFNALAMLFKDEKYKKFAVDVLMNYSGNLQADSDKEIFECDMRAFINNFSYLLDIRNFEHCAILNHFHTISERYEILCPDILNKYRQNTVFMLYLSIKNDRILLHEKWEDAELERPRIIDELCQKTSDDEFDKLWSSLETYDFDLTNSWDVETGIDLVFRALSDRPERFCMVLNSYISHGTPYDIQCHFIISTLIQLLGYDGAINFIESKMFDNKRKWLNCIYDNIPENHINESTSAFLEGRLIAQKDEGIIYTLSLTTVLRIEALQPGFAVKYISLMNDICKDQPLVISAFMSRIEVREEGQSDAIVNLFKTRMDVLETAYIGALRGRQYFDYKGLFLLQIIRRDIKFLSTFVKLLSAEQYHHNDVNLNILWDQDDYYTLITAVMEEIKGHQKCYSFCRLGEQLLSHKDDKAERWLRQDEWIKDYIIKNSTDADSIQFIFGKIRNLSDEQRKESILVFSKCNTSFPAFQCVPLNPSIMSWSGSEVPILENRIAFLDSLKNSLAGIEYIEHRAYLAERIQYIREMIDKELIREFVEGR